MADIGSIRATLVMDSSDFSKKMADVKTKLNDTGSSARKLSEDMNAIQRASLAVGTAVATGIGAAAAVSINFEAQMSRVKAIAGATESEFANLQDAALKLSSSTSKSASEIAIAFEDMAAKGFNATQIIEAMPGVIAAAEASGSDLALTADVVSSALNGFGLEAAEASRIADVLAKTSNISAATMQDMAYAFKYISPVAHSLGMDIEQVSAALALMINSGLDGSSAGTSLRQTLLSLNAPASEQAELMAKLGFSMRDSSGNAKDLSQIIAELTDVTKNMTEAERVATLAKLVGAEASSGLISIMNSGVGKLDSFTKSLKESAGASKEAADIMKDNVKASFDEFLGSLESLSIEITEDMLPAFREVIKYGTSIVNALSEMDGSGVRAGLAFAGVASTIALVGSSLAKLGIAMRAFTLTPLGATITGLSILGGLLVAAKVNSNDYNEAIMERIDSQLKEAEAMDGLINEYESLKGKLRLTSDELGRFVDLNSLLNQTADPNVIKALKDEQNDLLTKSGLTNDEMQRFVDINGKIIETVPGSNTLISEQGNLLLQSADAAKALNREKYEELRLSLETQKAVTQSKMRDYLLDQETLQKSINDLHKKKQEFIEDIAEKQRIVAEADRVYREEQAKGDDLAIFKAKAKLQTEQDQLDVMEKEYGELMKELEGQDKSLRKLETKIGKLDEVNQKMVALELKMVGINAKHGEEIKAIDTEIQKLDAKKKKLEDSTPAAAKTTQEYKDGITALENQIRNLNTAKSRIEEIIGKAQTMNYELGREIRKKIITDQIEYLTQVRKTALPTGPQEQKHTGGIVGRGQLPKLHAGGLPSQFTANHNEIDVRLLRNEMVLTEAQQANLMRMIDAGFTSNSGGSEFDESKLNAIIRVLEKATERPIVLKTDLNGREIAQEIYQDINELMEFDMRRTMTLRGMKY